jgi:hypothetical protein
MITNTKRIFFLHTYYVELYVVSTCVRITYSLVRSGPPATYKSFVSCSGKITITNIRYFSNRHDNPNMNPIPACTIFSSLELCYELRDGGSAAHFRVFR